MMHDLHSIVTNKLDSVLLDKPEGTLSQHLEAIADIESLVCNSQTDAYTRLSLLSLCMQVRLQITLEHDPYEIVKQVSNSKLFKGPFSIEFVALISRAIIRMYPDMSSDFIQEFGQYNKFVADVLEIN